MIIYFTWILYRYYNIKKKKTGSQNYSNPNTEIKGNINYSKETSNKKNIIKK